MRDIPELKPCPFCGGNDIDIDETDFGRADDPYCYIVSCKGCHANVYVDSDSTMEDAVAAWNRRAEA